jgi:hypothetical protein
MPEKKTMERAMKDKREGISTSTQAGEFVKEEMEHICEGKHGARSTKQAIAIGLSKARRAGVDLPPPKKARPASARAKAPSGPMLGAAARRLNENRRPSAHERSSTPCSAKASTPLRRLRCRQAKAAAHRRTAGEKHEAAMKAVHTKGHSGRVQAAKKAAQTRADHGK